MIGIARPDHQFNTVRLFSLGFLKPEVYASKPTPIHALKLVVISTTIQLHLCKTVMENFEKEVRLCKQNRRGYLPWTVYFMIQYIFLLKPVFSIEINIQ